MKRISLLLLAFIFTAQAFASSTTIKQADTIQNSTGGSALSVPSTGTTFATDTNTLTLTSKTISGASNTLSNIPVSALSTGTAIGVNTGGTGLATLTAGYLLSGNGTSSVNLIAPGSSGNVLTSNGSTWSSSAPSSSAPTVVSTFASPSSVTAVGGVTFTSTNALTVNYIAGSGGAVTVTASPQIAAGTVNGQMLTLVGTSATNTVKIQDGTGLALNGPWVGALSSVINLEWDNGASVWRETSRNN